MPIFIVQLVQCFNTIYVTLLVLHSLEVQAVQSDAQASSIPRSHKSIDLLLFSINNILIL